MLISGENFQGCDLILSLNTYIASSMSYLFVSPNIGVDLGPPSALGAYDVDADDRLDAREAVRALTGLVLNAMDTDQPPDDMVSKRELREFILKAMRGPNYRRWRACKRRGKTDCDHYY